MLAPSKLNLNTIPSVPIDDRRSLPSAPCIYFAIDRYSEIKYIGRAGNVKERWKNHHRHKQLKGMEGIRIAYLQITELALLPLLESILIDYFAPPLNKTPVMSFISSVDPLNKSRTAKATEARIIDDGCVSIKATVRIPAHLEQAYLDMTPSERGEIVKTWFETKETNS